MIDINDIAMDVDYDRLSFLISHLMHEKKRLGEKGVVEKYKDIEKFVQDDYEYNFMCGFLKHYGNRNGIAVEVFPRDLGGKTVIRQMDLMCIEEGCLTEEEFADIDKDIIPEFKEAGIYFKEIGEAI